MPSILTATWKWLRYILTDANNEWDITLLAWFAAVIIYLYKGWVAPSPFDFQAFGLGAAGVFGAGKALDWFTKRKDTDNVRDQHD